MGNRVELLNAIDSLQNKSNYQLIFGNVPRTMSRCEHGHRKVTCERCVHRRCFSFFAKIYKFLRLVCARSVYSCECVRGKLSIRKYTSRKRDLYSFNGPNLSTRMESFLDLFSKRYFKKTLKKCIDFNAQMGNKNSQCDDIALELFFN